MYENSGDIEQPKLQTLNDIITSEITNTSFKFKLSPDFFQKVLDCEIDLKEKFNPKIFFELINHYSKVIEYYESINDPKFLIYNSALNYLFEQPEAKKFMEGKDLGKEFRKKEIMKRFKQYESLITEEKVKVFIEKKANSNTIKSSIENLFNKDIDKQTISFKKKMEEKRLKYNEKYKDREKAKYENNNNSDINNNEIQTNNENEVKIAKNGKNNLDIEDNEKSKENENKIKEEKTNETDDFKFDGILNIEDIEEQEEISEIDFNIDDVVELVNIAKEENKENKKIENNSNKSNIEENSDSKEVSNANSNKNNYCLKKSLKMTNKTRFFDKMNDNFDNYFKGYYDYFINNNLELIIKDFEYNENEISKKINESSVNYFTQIRDMECLLDNKDNEESYKKEIGNIIKQLKEEQKDNVDKILSESEAKIKKMNIKYLINNSILKEKFKLDITKLLNSFLFK